MFSKQHGRKANAATTTCYGSYHHVIIDKATAHAQQSLSSIIDVLASSHLAILGLGPGALQVADSSRPGGPGSGRMLCNLLVCGPTYHLLCLVAAWPAPVWNLLAGLWRQTTAGTEELVQQRCHEASNNDCMYPGSPDSSWLLIKLTPKGMSFFYF